MDGFKNDLNQRNFDPYNRKTHIIEFLHLTPVCRIRYHQFENNLTTLLIYSIMYGLRIGS